MFMHAYRRVLILDSGTVLVVLFVGSQCGKHCMALLSKAESGGFMQFRGYMCGNTQTVVPGLCKDSALENETATVLPRLCRCYFMTRLNKSFPDAICEAV